MEIFIMVLKMDIYNNSLYNLFFLKMQNLSWSHSYMFNIVPDYYIYMYIYTGMYVYINSYMQYDGHLMGHCLES